MEQLYQRQMEATRLRLVREKILSVGAMHNNIDTGESKCEDIRTEYETH